MCTAGQGNQFQQLFGQENEVRPRNKIQRAGNRKSLLAGPGTSTRREIHQAPAALKRLRLRPRCNRLDRSENGFAPTWFGKVVDNSGDEAMAGLMRHEINVTVHAQDDSVNRGWTMAAGHFLLDMHATEKPPRRGSGAHRFGTRAENIRQRYLQSFGRLARVGVSVVQCAF